MRRFIWVQRPQVSVDGCSKKSFDDLKKVVRDNLFKPNVTINPIFEGSFDHIKLSSPDMVSTSSSQSSLVQSSNFGFSDSSISSTTSQRKKGKKGSNLIVKLMGLESPPSFPNLAKRVYDIDSPRVGYELGMKQRTVSKTLDTLSFKGLLRSNPEYHGLKPNSPLSKAFLSKERYINEKPSIVVLKPFHFPSLDLKEPIMPKFLDASTRTKEKLMKPRSRGSRANCEEKGKSTKKVTSSKGKDSLNLHEKPQRKVVPVKKAGEVEKVSLARRKEEKKKVRKSCDDLRSREQANLTTSKMKKRNYRMFGCKNETPSDHRMMGKSESYRQRRKNRQPAKVDKNRRCKGESKELEAICKEEIDSTSENHSVLQAVDSMIFDSFHTEKRVEASQIQITDHHVSHQITLSDAREGIVYSRSSVSVVYDQSSLRGAILITIHENGEIQSPSAKYENTVESSEATDSKSSRKSLAPRMKLKTLLSSSSSLMGRAWELFDLKCSRDLAPCTSDDTEPDLAIDRILLDCANEVMELLSLHFLQASLPLPRIFTTPRFSISIDLLLEEICNGIEDLRCHLRPGGDNVLFDNLGLLMGRDLSFKSGTWEVGWRNMFSKNEVEQVISEVDKLVIGMLIEEVVGDIVL